MHVIWNICSMKNNAYVLYIFANACTHCHNAACAMCTVVDVYVCTGICRYLRQHPSQEYAHSSHMLEWFIFNPARKIRRISFLCTDTYNYFTLRSCSFEFCFWSHPHEDDGAKTKGPSWAHAQADWLNIFSTRDVKYGSLHSLPILLPGLAWLVPDLGADPKSQVFVYL